LSSTSKAEVIGVAKTLAALTLPTMILGGRWTGVYRRDKLKAGPESVVVLQVWIPEAPMLFQAKMAVKQIRDQLGDRAKHEPWGGPDLPALYDPGVPPFQ
jgi:hypothetical protein